MIRRLAALLFATAVSSVAAPGLPAGTDAFIDTHCAGCHNDVDKEANLSLESLTFQPGVQTNFLTWTKIYEIGRAHV